MYIVVCEELFFDHPSVAQFLITLSDPDNSSTDKNKK